VQLAKAGLSTGELEFDGQAMHVELAEAPPVVEYVPALQFVQTADPVDSLYFPASHGAHVPPSGPEYPALHLQAANAGLPVVGVLARAGHVRHVVLELAPPATEYVPAKQSLHATAPTESLYFPATHAAHAPPSGPE
jgi:hypothetical protein